MQDDSLIYGIHAVRNAIKINPENIEKIVILSHRLNNENIKKILKVAHSKDINVQAISNKELSEIIPDKDAVHQDIIAYIKPNNDQFLSEQELSKKIESLDDKNILLLVLDGVQDPHNLGACIRTADAAGVKCVIFPKDNNATVNSTVRKVACGAVESVDIAIVTNLSRTLKMLQKSGFWIVGLAGDATQEIYDIDFKGAIAVVMGSEGKGLRHSTKEACDYLAKIPMNGAVSSLNISVATGVALYEAVKQRS